MYGTEFFLPFHDDGNYIELYCRFFPFFYSLRYQRKLTHLKLIEIKRAYKQRVYGDDKLQDRVQERQRERETERVRRRAINYRISRKEFSVH